MCNRYPTSRRAFAALVTALTTQPDATSDLLLIVADAAEEAAATLAAHGRQLATTEYAWLAATLREQAPAFANRPLPAGAA